MAEEDFKAFERIARNLIETGEASPTAIEQILEAVEPLMSDENSSRLIRVFSSIDCQLVGGKWSTSRPESLRRAAK